jgi:hypothetical protein
MGPTFMFQEVVCDSSEQRSLPAEIGEMLLLLLAHVHLDNQTNLYQMGQTIKVLSPTVTVSAVICRLKGEMIPFQLLNH